MNRRDFAPLACQDPKPATTCEVVFMAIYIVCACLPFLVPLLVLALFGMGVIQ